MSSEVTKIEIYPLAQPKGKTLAFGKVTLNHDLVIDGIKIIDGSKGLFVGMPSRKAEGSNNYNDIAFPITKELRKAIQETAVSEYKTKIAGSESTPSQVDDDDDLPF